MVSRFYIGKMDCAMEEQLIENKFRRVKEVEQLDFDLMNRILTVRHSLSEDEPLIKALKSIGMDPEVLAEGQHAPRSHATASCCSGAEVSKPTSQLAISIRDRWLMGLSGFFALGSEVYAWANGGEHTAPVVAAAILSIILGGRETIRKGIFAVKTLTLNINFLMTLAIIGAAIIGEWPEAAMVTFLFGVAEMIEALSLDRARHAIRSLIELAPDTAWVKNDSGEWIEVHTSQLAIGQVVRVRPGEWIATDGVVSGGSSTVNQAPITGESIPVAKSQGDPVFAGTINEKGSFEFEVTTQASGSTLARIIRAVQQAQGQKAPTQRFIDKFSRYYTPAVVIIAVLIAVIPTLFGQPFQPWLYKALVLLVIACPCALVISTPVTVVSALASAARRGILVKGGKYMEGGSRLDVLALDKTGTLTHGRPKVTDIVAFNGVSEDDVLRLAASLDAPSEHPVASAIVAAYTGPITPVTDFHSITGRGVKGSIDGSLYYIGNHRLAHEENYSTPEVESVLNRLEEEGKTVMILGDSSKALGVIAVADTLRDTSVEAIKELHKMGIRTLMLTGDNERTARAIAMQVGIDDARGGLLPEDKLTIIEELHRKGQIVGMVGDGINDAPALARANIGFAMGTAGTDTAIETADVALMKDDLRKIPEFIRLSQQASTVLKQNIAFAVIIKIVFFVLAFFGVATLWMAVFADMGASLIVVGNGLRLVKSSKS